VHCNYGAGFAYVYYLVYFGAIFDIWAIFSLYALFLHHLSKRIHRQLTGIETQPCGGILLFNSGCRPSRAARLWSMQFHRCAGHCLRQLNVRLIQTHVVDA